MVIIIPFNELLFELFPNEGDPESLRKAVASYYTVQGVVPRVTIENKGNGSERHLRIELALDKVAQRAGDRSRAIELCEQGKFTKAREILLKSAKEDPTDSECHRLLGQIEAELGHPDKAIDHLIDALRWDPRNKHALTMMGNIWARDKHDVETALRYYRTTLEVDPNDHIAANNIAAQFAQREDWETAHEWFDKALAIEPNYPNTHHGLALVSLNQGDLASAFYSACEAMRVNRKRDQLYQQSLKLASDLAQTLTDQVHGQAVVERKAKGLSINMGKQVRLVRDESIPTAAKLEIAENHDRSEHLVKYKPSYPAVEHLQLHELYHLEYVKQARDRGENELFLVRGSAKEDFIRSLGNTVTRLHQAGYSEESIGRYLSDLFEGINRQAFNAPVDLFIEWDIYHDHPIIRPFQFISLGRLVKEALHATTEKRVVELSPASVLGKSKVYNLTLAMLYMELFGVDLVQEFKPTVQEEKLAQEFYSEFKEYRHDREPGEEYEIIQHWAEDLGLDSYFELVKETDYRNSKKSTADGQKGKDLERQLKDIEDDPVDQFKDDPEKAEAMRTFLAGEKSMGVNMAVTLFMVDALEYFQNQTPQKIRETAFEIAMLGTQGIHPGNKGYKLHHVPGKSFSGYHLLAYYYVSWKLVLPEMLTRLQLPYDQEYELAVSLNKKQ